MSVSNKTIVAISAIQGADRPYLEKQLTLLSRPAMQYCMWPGEPKLVTLTSAGKLKAFQDIKNDKAYTRIAGLIDSSAPQYLLNADARRDIVLDGTTNGGYEGLTQLNLGASFAIGFVGYSTLDSTHDSLFATEDLTSPVVLQLHQVTGPAWRLRLYTRFNTLDASATFIESGNIGVAGQYFVAMGCYDGVAGTASLYWNGVQVVAPTVKAAPNHVVKTPFIGANLAAGPVRQNPLKGGASFCSVLSSGDGGTEEPFFRAAAKEWLPTLLSHVPAPP